LGKPKWANCSGGGFCTPTHSNCSTGTGHFRTAIDSKGASQAIEDAVTIATCLELAIKKGIPIADAMKAYELLRFNRSVATMKLGEQVRDVCPSVLFN
jgi:hypothetical protein